MGVKFRAFGIPVPQGSMRAFMVGGKPRITSAAKGLKEWRRIVSDAAQKQMSMWTAEPGQPIGVQLDFYMPRPKGHYGTKGLKVSAPPFPAKRPDIDKLIRACLDAIKPLIHDDAQVCWVLAHKYYADVENPAGVELHAFPMNTEEDLA
jgi:Holliday junction resolvase RusA-like endonuclease